MPRFAQHFLINKHAIERIVESVQLTENDFVVEIGPGKGALTSHMVSNCKQLTVIEVDPIWAERLKHNFGSHKSLTILQQDVLTVDFQELSEIEKKWKIVGNLPYNLTSPILRKICEWDGWDEAWVMVQKEVGDRMTATAGSEAYGALTAGLSLSCIAKKVFNLSQGSFDPAPKVESSVVYLKRREKALTDNLALTQRVIQAAFQQRRKTILNSLSHGLNLTKEITKGILEQSRIDVGIRPEQLKPEQFIVLSQIAEAHLK